MEIRTIGAGAFAQAFARRAIVEHAERGGKILLDFQ
jgi:hypothetical protein